ncbi:uncharacterized protein LOC119990184 [Tripterygium wilfordii]|uniref:uncharacterized protein LOC119990184 n=1 Tax=Tripterygium wilfordii TaxID=458696 RepID=UPI0018F84C4C|nr:uncharacterized protein LOC119990184 [Tripterygium wilfordii]
MKPVISNTNNSGLSLSLSLSGCVCVCVLMEIREKILQYRNHFATAIIASLALSTSLYAAPRLLAILVYFWPLLASTAVLLVMIIAFGGVSQLATDGHGEKAGAGCSGLYKSTMTAHDVEDLC